MLTRKILLFLVGGMITALATACFSYVVTAQTDNSFRWLAPTDLYLQQQSGISTMPSSANGNIDCYLENNSICAYSTPYGTAGNGSIRLANSPDYQPVISFIDGRQHFIGIPHSNTFISYTTEPAYGLYLYFNYNLVSSIAYINNGLGAYYQVNRPPDGVLSDKSNRRLAADYTSMSFSENGQWMVVSDPNVAMLRVNLQTFEVLPFAPGFDYSIGLSPAPQTAITNDGRYAVVSSKDFNSIKIYDLDTCAQPPLIITGPAGCQARDLQSFVQSNISEFSTATNLRFINDDTLSLYAGYSQNPNSKFTKYILSDISGSAHRQDYLGIGDSYISGEGVFRYAEGTDTANNLCHLSLASYPLNIGRQLNYNSYHSVACSGARIKDIIDTSDTYIGQAKPKITKLQRGDSVPSILTDFQPGYIAQLEFIEQYQPNVATISIGGNDIGFSTKLRGCVGPGTCYSTFEDRLEYVREVNRIFPKLVSAYSQLKSASPPDTKIFVIGYPQIAMPDGDCALNVHFNNDELLFTQQAISYLDTIISLAASRAGVFYVDSQNAFYGHRLCEAGPGSVAMNGLTAGNDIPGFTHGPIGNESYHPNGFGHQLLSDNILASTQNFTAAMPASNLNSSLPQENGLDILKAPHSGRAVNIPEYDPSLSADLTFQGSPTDFTIDGSQHALAPSTTLQAEIHSTPLKLGSFTTGNNGNLSGQVLISSAIPAGYHTLHFYGTDIAGQNIDIYKDIYVAANVDDLDGNGIGDSTQKCIGVESSAQDYDQDGIDDSCDGVISALPADNPEFLRTENSVAATSSSDIGSPSADTPILASRYISKLASSPKVLSATISRPSTGTNSKENNLRLAPKYIAYSLGLILLASFIITLF